MNFNLISSKELIKHIYRIVRLIIFKIDYITFRPLFIIFTILYLMSPLKLLLVYSTS